jgi:stearoyl-CoA desaturase (delta-9 desaturase)
MLGILTYCFLLYLLGGLGASLGYHRILTHKSADLPKWLEYSIVLLGLPAGTPIQWVGNHRAHHNHTDKKGDPHSPHIDGFWYAHCGWYIQSKNWIICLLYALAGPVRLLIDSFLRPRTNQEHINLAHDISSDKLYAFVSKPLIYMLILWGHLCFILIIPYIIFDWTGILAASITLTIIYNLGDSVDSFGHLFGEKIGKNEARNNTILGILAFGDGWHANHHKHPQRAKHGIKKNQPDFSYLILKFGKLIGVIKKIH